jgi:hypothetical protein
LPDVAVAGGVAGCVAACLLRCAEPGSFLSRFFEATQPLSAAERSMSALPDVAVAVAACLLHCAKPDSTTVVSHVAAWLLRCAEPGSFLSRFFQAMQPMNACCN